METITSFALDLQRDDQLMSWDIQSGYQHFYLHPVMRDMFMFRYNSRYYRCIALPFGWGRSVLWFTKLLRPLVQYLREKCAYRVLPYIDDFLLAPSPGSRRSIARECRRARDPRDALFGRLGLTHHPTKGC